MYCCNCGKEIDEKAVICIHCGVETSNFQKEVLSDDSNIGWAILGFFIPVAGLTLFLVWKETKPKASKSVGIGALISTILSIVCVIFFYLLIFFIALTTY